MSKVQATTKGGVGSVTITTKDEGITLSTTVNTLNFTGAGVVASGAGTETTINIPGGAGASWTEIEIDFGSGKGVTDKDFTVVDAGSSASAIITVVPSGKPATGRVGNDFAWDAFTFSALPGIGSFVFTAMCSNGTVVGRRKVQYTIS